MSYIRKEGKDTITFLTETDQKELQESYQSKKKNEADSENNHLVAAEDSEDMKGAIGPDGEIDWDCPCLKGMVDGPCGEDFKTAFSCFVKSTEEPKGMDCVDAFRSMQECMVKNPEYYGSDEDSKKSDQEENSQNSTL